MIVKTVEDSVGILGVGMCMDATVETLLNFVYETYYVVEEADLPSIGKERGSRCRLTIKLEEIEYDS